MIMDYELGKRRTLSNKGTYNSWIWKVIERKLSTVRVRVIESLVAEGKINRGPIVNRVYLR